MSKRMQRTKTQLGHECRRRPSTEPVKIFPMAYAKQHIWSFQLPYYHLEHLHQGATPPENPRRDTQSPWLGRRLDRGAPSKIEGLAVLKSKSKLQAPAKYDLTPGKPRQISRPYRTLFCTHFAKLVIVHE